MSVLTVQVIPLLIIWMSEFFDLFHKIRDWFQSLLPLFFPAFLCAASAVWAFKGILRYGFAAASALHNSAQCSSDDRHRVDLQGIAAAGEVIDRRV